jgi:hypothetical protein
MLDFAKGFGLAGAAGALLGLIAVTVIAPATPGGVAILMAIPILICSFVGGIYKWARGDKGKKKDDKDDDSKDEDEGGDNSE